MLSNKSLTRLIMSIVLPGLAWACAATPVKPPEAFYYITPEVTYLHDRPGYEGNILGPLFKGDKVELVHLEESDWWQVKLLRSGQKGWVRKELLSPEPVSTAFFYVNEDNLPLRECPGSECLPLQMLFRGDQVQKMEEGERGWWRVLVIKSRSLGWAPAAALADSFEETQKQQARKPYYYVAVAKSKLRSKPSERSEVIRTFKFNEQVEKIGEAGSWFKVRQPSSNARGWVLGRDLSESPMILPRGQYPGKKEMRPYKQREEPLVEPEFM
ncbi:MAG: hypothetical protein C4567_17215 [Deltaproteobacteria bacterium]|nr:MAG: hypothetical protein C4567_17215 [Deltaproteobacteria bacterium]